MQPDRPRQQVLIGDRDVTDRCDSLTYSAVDNGGFEICTLGLPAVDRPKKGAAIIIRQGLEVAWAGRVAEIADHSQHGRATKTTGGEGWRALLRDAAIQMIYVDRDLTRWGAPSNARQLFLIGQNKQLGASTVAPSATGSPAVVQTITDSWTSPYEPQCEAWYDAGPGNLLASMYYNTATSPALSGAWAAWPVQCSDDVNTAFEQGPNVVGQAFGYFAGGQVRRYAMLQFQYLATPAGAQGQIASVAWQLTAVYGNHGMTGRGATDPQGFYPSDIARHALSQCKGVSAGNIVDSSGFVIPHLVYRTPTAADVIIDDMAKLMGWTWGVWEPPTIFGTSPRLDFRPPPTDATCVITKAECDQLDVTSRLGDLYDTCTVSYTDPAGTVGTVTVSLPNPQLIEAGIAGRTLQLNMGVGSAAAATSFAQFALTLSQTSSRAAGQATLPVAVRLPGGGRKPACLIRPGIDRLRIVDLIDAGPLLDIGNIRRDVFRISRIETTVGKDGFPSTRVELDNGPNLLEVLQARLSTDVGFGASGG